MTSRKTKLAAFAAAAFSLASSGVARADDAVRVVIAGPKKDPTATRLEKELVALGFAPVAVGALECNDANVANAVQNAGASAALCSNSGRVAVWTDWVTVGALTVVLGVVVLVIPPDISDSFTGDKGVQGLLTSPIIIVGVLGAWAVITGVLQAIAAASPKLAARGASRTPDATPASEARS